MSTIENFFEKDVTKNNPIFSQLRTTIETAFYANNVRKISDLMMAYKLAAANSATIVTDLPIAHAKELGLPTYAKMLVDNHGAIVGRTASARHLIDDPNEDSDKLSKILQEAIYVGARRNFYKTEVVVGLDTDFMLKAHLMLPEGFEMNLLSYMLNFQNFNEKYLKMYVESKEYPEGDIYLYADPFWTNSEYPNGLVIFDAAHNAGAILGLRYFGELKKATLTLAWAIAHRNGYTACHGGAKAFHFKNRQDKVFAFYGLSGSGKSTLTHAKHEGKFDITVLHDDAFVISRKNGSSIALEPAYFDKTNDYLPGTRETKYFTTIMNVGVTLNKKGEKILVTEDLRNGNGRTIKSRYSSINRVDKEKAPMDAIFWIMKDDSLPPILKLEDPTVAATFGVTLATKRSTAENLTGSTDENTLVIEPFADPFRAYPLNEDYKDFKELFEKRDVDCYIVNTAEYNGLDISKEVTLNILEDIVNNKIKWTPFGGLSGISNANTVGYSIDFSNTEYVNKLKKRIEIRRNWVEQHNLDNPYDKLPIEVLDILNKLLEELN